MFAATAYKDYRESGISWLGEIPSHWIVTKFKRYCDIQLGKMLQPQPNAPSDIQVPYLRAVHVQWERVDISDLPEMWASEKEVKKFQVKSGDLLVCEGGEVGRTAILEGIEGDCIIQNALHKIRGNINTFAPYINYLMRHIADARWFEILCNKATIAHLTGEKLGELGLPLPSPEEQQAIARFLDFKTAQIDALIAKQKTLLDKLAEKRTALISHAVTKGLDPSVPMKDSGVAWLGQIPAHWEAKRTKFSVSFIGSGKTPKGGSEVYVQDGIMILRSQNIHDKGLRLDDVAYITDEADAAQPASRVFAGDVLLNITGASIGRASIVPTPFPQANVNQHVCILRPMRNLITPEYLHLLLCSRQAKNQISSLENGTSREGLNFPQVGGLQFAFPPVDEQVEIVASTSNKLEAIDLQCEKVMSVIGRLIEYRSAIITNSVTGKIDVRSFQIPSMSTAQESTHA